MKWFRRTSRSPVKPHLELGAGFNIINITLVQGVTAKGLQIV